MLLITYALNFPVISSAVKSYCYSSLLIKIQDISKDDLNEQIPEEDN